MKLIPGGKYIPNQNYVDIVIGEEDDLRQSRMVTIHVKEYREAEGLRGFAGRRGCSWTFSTANPLTPKKLIKCLEFFIEELKKSL